METEITDKAKKIVASSIAGIGVLGSLLGFGAKKLANDANAQEVTAVTEDLQQNSEQLLAIADELGGEEGAKAMEVAEYIGQVTAKMAQGETPSPEELQNVQDKLQDLGGQPASADAGGNPGSSSERESEDSEDQSDSGREDTVSADNSHNKDDSGREETISASTPTSVNKPAGENKSETDNPAQESSGKSATEAGSTSPESGREAQASSDSSEKSGSEEVAADVESITQQLEELSASLGEITEMWENVNEESEEETEQLTEVNQQIDELLENLTTKFTDNETEIDTQQQEALNQLAELDQLLMNLVDDSQVTESNSLEEQQQILTQFEEQKQSLQDNTEKIEIIVKQIVEGEISNASDSNSAESDYLQGETVSLPTNLTAITEKMETSFTPFQDLITQINQELNTAITNTEINFTSLVELLTNSDNELGELISTWVSHLKDDQENKINAKLTNSNEKFTANAEEFEQTNEDLLNKFQSDCQSFITKMKEQLEDKAQSQVAAEASNLERQLAQLLNQAEENNQLVSDQETILTKINNLSEQLLNTEETAQRMTDNLGSLAV